MSSWSRTRIKRRCRVGERERESEREKVGYLAFTSPLIVIKLDDSSDIHLSVLSHIKHAQI